jgi:orotidine-5'-phosphate decarboxylase
MSSPVILALDTKEPEQARNWIKIARPTINHFKIGLEFYLLNGKESVAALQKEFDFELFLDLKLYDIPNTVKGAVESVASLKPKFLTVHAAGGPKMITAASESLPGGSIAAVTVLTSFKDDDFKSLGYLENIPQTAKRWAEQAIAAGATSLICSPFEAASMKSLAPNSTIITPGVRLLGESLNDQNRVMTPKEALDNGADFVVIGRSITSCANISEKAMQDKITEIHQLI